MDNSKFHVINLVEYEPPSITESTKENWVSYGTDNDYYDWVIDRYVNSPTNNAVINNVVKLIYGKGLKATDSASKPNEYAQMVSLFKKDDLRQLIMDLKMLGQCAIQVVYNEDRSRIIESYHVPIQLLRPEKCNEEGLITGYYFSNDWSDPKKYVPERIEAFGYGTSDTQIYCVKPYSPNLKYFAYPDYLGGLQYAVLEEEIANYLVNEAQNSFSGTKILNFNNGIPSEEERDAISRDVIRKLTGTQGQKLIVAFNHDEANKTTIDDVSLDDAPTHYEYLSDEAMRKILLSHHVVSPLILGIATSNGFSSNADELKNSFILYENMTLKPYREMLVDALENILAYNEVNLNLYFETLKPLEFTDPLGKAVVEEELSKNVNLKSVVVDDNLAVIDDRLAYSSKEKAEEMATNIGCEGVHEHDFEGKTWYMPCATHNAGAEELSLPKKFDASEYGHTKEKNWVLIDSFDVDYDKESEIDEEISLAQEKANLDIEKEKLSRQKKPTKLQQIRKILLDDISANPDEVSELDWVINGFYFITRYKYEEASSPKAKGDSREFCKEMMNADLLYRKEDIDRMSSDGVNGEFAPAGKSSYDILRWKGGVYCHHSFKRQIFIGLDTGEPLDPDSLEAQQISISRARKYGYNLKDPKGTAIAPINTQDRGSLKNK
jgi:hypothetical protein